MESTIISIQELETTIEALQSYETADRALLQPIDDTELRGKLLQWAASGFPRGYVLYSRHFRRLDKCSDGISRADLVDYISYLDPSFSIAVFLQQLETRLPGMSLSYSYTSDFSLQIHVSKK